MGTALLYYIFSADSENDVPENIRERVMTAYNLVRILDHTLNPVIKIPIVIYGDESEVYVDEVGENIIGAAQEAQEQNNQQQQPQQQQAQQQQAQQQQPQQIGNQNGQYFIQRLNVLQGGLLAVRNEVTEIRKDAEVDRTRLTRQHQTVLSNIQRIAIRPAVAIRRGNNNNNGGNSNNTNPPANIGAPGNNPDEVVAASLSPTPRSLYVLWHEWLFGIGGRKAARLFTAQERGREKFKYCRRKVVWDLVGEMVRSGLESNVAIDRIYAVYGANRTTTYIINQLKIDRRNNTLHPTLRV